MPPASLSTLAVMKPGPMTASSRTIRRAPALEELHRARQFLCRSIVITSSAVMMPASRPCSSTTASVIRLYLSNSAATSSCGVSGAQVMYGSLSCDSWIAGDEIGDLDERHGADQLLRRRRSGRSSPALRGCLRSASAPRSHRRRPRFPATAMNSVVMRPAAVCSPNSSSCVTSCRSSGCISWRISSGVLLGRGRRAGRRPRRDPSPRRCRRRDRCRATRRSTPGCRDRSPRALRPRLPRRASRTPPSRSAGGRSSTMSAMSAGCSFDRPS